MSFNLWDTEQEEALVQQCEHHTEFVVGLDFNIFIEGQVARCVPCFRLPPLLVAWCVCVMLEIAAPAPARCSPARWQLRVG